MVSFSRLILGVGVFITRGVQRWLENTYLPATDLDAGLRNSISTVRPCGSRRTRPSNRAPRARASGVPRRRSARPGRNPSPYGIGILGVGVFITRGVQRWLENTYLPATDLDAGLPMP
jgi:hypothetical protein